jgi:hypothetical protein
MVTTVSKRAKEIDRGKQERHIDLPSLFQSFSLFLNGGNHPLYEAVLDH